MAMFVTGNGINFPNIPSNISVPPSFNCTKPLFEALVSASGGGHSDVCAEVGPAVGCLQAAVNGRNATQAIDWALALLSIAIDNYHCSAAQVWRQLFNGGWAYLATAADTLGCGAARLLFAA